MKNKTLFWILLFLPFFLVGRSTMAESQTPKEIAATGDALLAETGTQWQSKVEETLLGTMNSEIGQDIVVLFSKKADLQTASALSWHDRGEMVLQSLRATAQTAQAQAVQLLKTHKNAYTSYGRHFSANALCIIGLKDVGLLRKIAALPEVERIFASPEIHFLKPVSTRPADNSQTGVAWGVQDINAPEIWTSGHHGEGIVVGSIDTGVRYTHEALVRQYRGNLGNGVFDHNYNWYDPLQKDDVPTDSDGHGTHTVGTMVGDNGKGHQIGVAPEAQWIACRHGENLDGLLTCMDWMLAPTDLDGRNPNPDKRPHVVNNSWGLTKPAYSVFEEAIQSWRNAGIFPAFAAGNSGGCETVLIPAGYDTSFTTGAYDAEHEIAGFSSRGPYPDNPWIKPDVAAPGYNIYSASNQGDDQYKLRDGTSMASPHTAGLMALLWSARPDLMRNISETEQALRDTAIPVANTSCDLLPTNTGVSGSPNSVWGYGRISSDVIYWPGSNGFYITPARQRQLGSSGETVTYTYFLVNQGSSEIAANLTLSDSQWTTRLSEQRVTVPPQEKVSFSVEHGISYLPSPDEPDEETVTITASTAQSQTGAAFSTRNLTPYTPVPGSVSHELFAENFEGDFPPPGWRLENLAPYDCGWTDGRTAKKENHTGGSGNFAIGAREICTEGMDTVLLTPTVDLNNVPPTATLWLQFKDYYVFSRGLLKLSRDGGVTWEEMAFSCEESPCSNLFYLGNNVNGTLQFRFSRFVSSSSWLSSSSWEVDDINIHYLIAPESGAVIPSVNDKGCAGQATSEMTLCNFNEKDVFDMTYYAPSGSVSGPPVVGPVFKNGILSFQVRTHTPVLPLGTTQTFTVTATGQKTGAVAMGTINRTADQDEWHLGTPMPYSTSSVPAFVHDGKIYVGGGTCAGVSNIRGEFILFDPDSNSWKVGAPQPYPYFTKSRCGVLGKNADGEAVYTLFPGSDDGGTPGVIHAYHMDRDVWTTTALPPQLPDVLYGPACVSDLQNNVGYICGGKSGASDSEDPYMATLYRYHPDTGTVEELPKMTTPRSHHAAWLWGGMICVAGGTCESGLLDSTQCFDLSAGSWNPENSDLPRLPNPWSGMGCDLLKGNPFLAGAYSEIWIPVALAYDPARGTWENLSSPPRARINVSGVTLNEVFHLMGGQKRLQGRVLDSTTHQILTPCDIAPPLPLHR